MRWERLFEDLEAELEAADRDELEAEIAERTRHERAQLGLLDRLRGSVGRLVVLRVWGAGQVTGELRAVGADWLLLRPNDGSDRLVRAGAVLEISGLAATSAVPAAVGTVAARFTFGAVLRGLARDRALVTVVLVDGSSRTGTIDVAGADLLDLAERRLDEVAPLGRAGETVRRGIPYDAVAVVREH